MKIVIVGAGEVGYNIAGRLSLENKEVVVIDKNPNSLHRISEALDVQTVIGSGSNPKILKKAGIREAEILLAVTDSDETNLVACLMTDIISPTTKKLLRLREAGFESYHERLKKENPHIDTVINPEIELVDTIRKLIEVPGATDVGDFVDGQVKYVGIRLNNSSPMVGLRLLDFNSRFGRERPLIAAIIRKNEVIVPRGSNTLRHNDLVYFACETEKLEATLKLFNIAIEPIQKVFIIGGGRIGERLARLLEKDSIQASIIESDIKRCEYLSEQLEKTIILHGNGSDQKLFLEENINKNDVIVAVTDDDETNILISLMVKNIGIENTITRINKPNYFPLLTAIGIQKIVSPRLSAVSSILQAVRKGKVLSDISIFGERGEFLEAIALETSDITNRPLKKISFPKGAILICIIRENTIMLPAGDSIIKPGDRIITFAVKQAVKNLEKMLTVKLDFF